MQPEQIAAKILDDDIRDMTELRRMVGNPRAFAMMCRIVDESRKNGDVEADQPRSLLRLRPTTAATNANRLKEEVIKRCAAIRTDITVAGITEQMVADNYQFISSDPKVAVGDVVRRITGTNLRITKEGSGRIGHIYEYIDG